MRHLDSLWEARAARGVDQVARVMRVDDEALQGRRAARSSARVN